MCSKVNESKNNTMRWKELSINRNYLYGIAIIWIMIFHLYFECMQYWGTNWLATIVVCNGNIGVDFFLFLSGVSLFFSMAKKDGVLKFYGKRLKKIGTIYLFLCIPFYIAFWAFWKNNLNLAIKEIFFLNMDTNHFWFFACIALCYLIYPIIYYLITSNKKIILYFSLICYIVGLLALIRFNADLYYSLNRVVTRIPIFVFGAIAGELVYKDKIISPKLIFAALIGLFLKRPIESVLFGKDNFNAYCHGFDRIYGGLIAFAVIILLCMVLPFLKELKVMNLIGFFGKYTLELYVLHGIYIDVLKECIGITFDSNKLLFTVLYFVLPAFTIYILDKVKKKPV